MVMWNMTDSANLFPEVPAGSRKIMRATHDAGTTAVCTGCTRQKQCRPAEQDQRYTFDIHVRLTFLGGSVVFRSLRFLMQA
jgi:hypothetical protein